VPLQGTHEYLRVFDSQGGARPFGLALPWAMIIPAFQAGAARLADILSHDHFC
jgi:hypothetical protein